MIGRVFVALLGAIVITGALLLGMDTVTSMFRERDGGKYFRITDILPRQAPDRPTRPEPVMRGPGLPEGEVDAPATRIPLETPGDFDPGRPTELIVPDIDPRAAAPADD
jgi:hypothetical protein